MNISITTNKSRKNSLLTKIKKAIVDSNKIFEDDEELRIAASKIFIDSMMNK